VPSVGNNLATFMGARLAASFTNMNCQNFGLTNPVTVTTDGNGVATAVTYNTAQQQMKLPTGATGGRQGGYDRMTRCSAGRGGAEDLGAAAGQRPLDAAERHAVVPAVHDDPDVGGPGADLEVGRDEGDVAVLIRGRVRQVG